MSSRANKISVIVPCFNYGHFLAECLNSVLAQTYQNWECIIVDNASTDNTSQVAKVYTSKDNRFRYLFCDRPGVANARNSGIAGAEGEFILPLDADDKISDAYLEEAIKAFTFNPKLKLVYCKARLFGHRDGSWTLPVYSYKGLLIENSIFCSALFRKEDFLQTGGYSIEMAEGFEDWEFWIRFLNNESQVLQLNEELFYYRIRESSRNNSLDREKQLRLRKLIFDLHKEKYEKHFALHELLYENLLLRKQEEILKFSPEQRIGKALLFPLRALRKIFG